MSDESIPQKTCTKCGLTLPATSEYFAKNAQGKYGLRGDCRNCFNALQRQRAKDNPKPKRQITRLTEQEKIERTKASHRKQYLKDKQRQIDYNREWRSRNPEKARESARKRTKAFRERNPEKVNEWAKKNPQRAKFLGRRWRIDNPEQYRVTVHNRRAIKTSLPNTLTTKEWEYAIGYFNGCCAVCGRQLKDLFGSHTVSADHWTPISHRGADNPGTVATNIIPLCHGLQGCNNSKGGKMPEKWLIEKYGKHQATKIMERIQRYFDSLQ